jgi:5-methylcytosine-specific restriction endonuclease McrA
MEPPAMANAENARPIITCQAAKAAGLKRYFITKPCPKGHIAERLVSNNACIVCAALRQKVGDIANPAKKKARFKAWYDRNRDAWLAKKAADRKADPRPFKARYKRWSEANPEHVLANIRRRQARKKDAEGHHTGTEIKALFRRQGGKCVYCRTPLKKGYHADHIIPISKGGSNWISNIQLTCSDCNHRKWAKDPIAWARQIGRLL